MCTEELNGLVRDYIEIDNQIKERQVIEESIKDSIKRIMEENNLEEVEVGEHVVRYKDVLTLRFDATSFKKKYDELYNLYLKNILSKKFSIN